MNESSRIAIHQPNFNPYLGVMAKYLLSETVIHLDTVQFVKNEFQNRNRIRAGEKPQWLTVPVIHSFGQSLLEVRINPRVDWRETHLKTLRQNYLKAPRFPEVFPRIETLYEFPTGNLVEWNLHFLTWVFDEMEIKKPMRRASELEGIEGARDERLIALCRRLGASRYLAGSGGLDYMRREPWDRAGIEVRFLRYHHPQYPQGGTQFVPYCGVLDLLFHVEPTAAREVILSGVELVDWPNPPSAGERMPR
ncbi:MAG: hypothetical protein GHCLOJNM_01248 [bacterium]|nr:hypothetical protein [bacterium]